MVASISILNVFVPEIFICYSHLTSGAGIAQWYSAGLRAEWSEVRISEGAGDNSLHYRVQTGSGVHPASFTMCTRDPFPGGKAVGS
jgi:hypothetical protein